MSERWDEVVALARAELDRMERCPDGCGHVVCGLSDRVIEPGETVTYRVERMERAASPDPKVQAAYAAETRTEAARVLRESVTARRRAND